MKTLLREDERREIERRLDALTPDATAQWGRMTPHQALCHLADAFRMVFGEREIAMKTGVMERTVIRFFALTLPVAWPKSVPTAPEIDQEQDGTSPEEFETDREALRSLLTRFVESDGTMPVHPIFGNLTRGEWGRWAYRHMDHHLSQFGA